MQRKGVSYHFTNRRLFFHKLTVLIFGTAILVPLVHFKLYVPATAYVAALLILHVAILYLYFARTPWRVLLLHKREFALRISAVVMFAWLLTIVSFEGTLLEVLLNATLALILHVAILLGLMVERRRASDSQTTLPLEKS